MGSTLLLFVDGGSLAQRMRLLTVCLPLRSVLRPSFPQHAGKRFCTTSLYRGRPATNGRAAFAKRPSRPMPIRCLSGAAGGAGKQVGTDLTSTLRLLREQEAKGLKPKAGRANLRRLFGLAAGEKWKIAAAIGLLCVSSAVTMAVPYGIGKVIDTIFSEDEGMRRLRDVTLAIGGIFVVGGLANFGRVYLFQTTSQNIIANLRTRVFRSILHQETAFFDKNQSGELINRLSSDTNLVGRALTDNISDGLRGLAQAVAGFGMMAYMSPKLTAAVVVIVPVVGGMAAIYGKYVKNLTRIVQDSLADATQVGSERIANIRTVRAFANEEKEIDRYAALTDHVRRLGHTEALARGLFFGSTGMTGNFIMLGVLWYGGHMMHAGEITVGHLTSFLIYTAYVGMAVVNLSSSFSDLMKGVGASGRLFELLDRQPSMPLTGGKIIPQGDFKGAIEFKDVHFAYETRKDAAVFSGLDLSIPSNTVVGVVGPSGSGKSTLGALLFRLYDVNSGSVSVDGCDVRELDPHWLRSHIGVVSQEPVLFSGTIAENIAYGCPDASMDQIVNAAHKANAHQFIQEFPDGYNTLVGERGQSLSGGQKQRVAIARALLKNPAILLLDEATSALDAESERLVQDSLENHLLVGRTSIIIAHRLSTIKQCGSIAVLDGGKVVEHGTYKELMERTDGHFRKLVERQAVM